MSYKKKRDDTNECEDIDDRGSLQNNGVTNVNSGSGTQNNYDQSGNNNTQNIYAAQKEKFLEIADWITPINPWSNHDTACRQHVKDTGDWLLQCEKYNNWKNGESRHLWLHGLAGCGKTVLCSTAIRDIDEHTKKMPDTALAIFYFTFSDNQKQTYENLLRSLVRQLGWIEPVATALRQANEKGDQKILTVEGLEAVLLQAVTAFKQVFVMLDALDESPGANGVQQELLERLGMLVEKDVRLKLFCTSRPSPDLSEFMNDLTADKLPLGNKMIDPDIRMYVAVKLTAPRLRSCDSIILAHIRERLADDANGMFRWTHLLMQKVHQLKDVTLKNVKKVLNDFPKDLDDVYSRMLSLIEVDDREKVSTLLRWITYATRPLTLGELVDTVAIDTESKTVDFEDRGTPTGIIRLLSDMVTVINDEKHRYADDDAEYASESIHPGTQVRLAHFTVQEYLESDRVPQCHKEHFCLQHDSGHLFLTRACLLYLTHYSRDDIKSLTKKDLTTYSLLEYTSRSWYSHSLQHHGTDVKPEVEYLQQHLEDWLLVHNPEYSHRGAFGYYGIDNHVSGDALYHASVTGLISVVQTLLDEGADIDVVSGEKGAALHAACYYSKTDVVKLLIDRGADVNAAGGYHRNALQAASYMGRIEIVKLLLDRGADVNAAGGLYGNALQAASVGSNIEIVKLLIDRGADVNAAGGEYGNALQAASVGSNIEIVKLLIDRGANVNAAGGHYGNALQAASFAGFNIEIVKLLIDRGADVNAAGGEYGNALQAASVGSNIEIVKLLIDRGANVNAAGGEYGNALQAACAALESDIEIVKLLIDEGADVDAAGGVFGNALKAAIRGNHVDIEHLLRRSGARDINDETHGNNATG